MLSKQTTNRPTQKGKFGPYGGQFVPEILMHALRELTDEYHKAIKDPAFIKELKD